MIVKGGRWPKYCTLGNPRLVNNKNMCMCTWSHFSCVWLYVTLWTVALQALLSMEFSRQEYWTGLPCPTWGNLPDPGIEPTSHMSPALASRFFSTNATWEGQQEYRDDCFLRGLNFRTLGNRIIDFQGPFLEDKFGDSAWLAIHSDHWSSIRWKMSPESILC